MAFIGYLFLGAAALIFSVNFVFLWENTKQGSGMNSSIPFHQGTFLASILAGMFFVFHPLFRWWYFFAAVVFGFLLTVPIMSAAEALFRLFRKPEPPE